LLRLYSFDIARMMKPMTSSDLLILKGFRAGTKWGQRQDVFIHTFVWNSLTTNYMHTRDEGFFAVVDQATAAYCHKGV